VPPAQALPATAAALLDLARIPTGVGEIKTVQLMNATLGCALLAFAWRFIGNLPVSGRAQFFGFALLALNPKLVGINAQATNDTFVIFFDVAALYFA